MNSKNLTYLEIPRVIQVHCKVFNNDYQSDSIVSYLLVQNKSFRQLLEISPTVFIFLRTFTSEFSYIEVCFTDQNSNSLKIEDKIKLPLVIQ